MKYNLLFVRVDAVGAYTFLTLHVTLCCDACNLEAVAVCNAGRSWLCVRLQILLFSYANYNP